MSEQNTIEIPPNLNEAMAQIANVSFHAEYPAMMPWGEICECEIQEIRARKNIGVTVKFSPMSSAHIGVPGMELEWAWGDFLRACDDAKNKS